MFKCTIKIVIKRYWSWCVFTSYFWHRADWLHQWETLMQLFKNSTVYIWAEKPPPEFFRYHKDKRVWFVQMNNWGFIKLKRSHYPPKRSFPVSAFWNDSEEKTNKPKTIYNSVTTICTFTWDENVRVLLQ